MKSRPTSPAAPSAGHEQRRRPHPRLSLGAQGVPRADTEDQHMSRRKWIIGGVAVLVIVCLGVVGMLVLSDQPQLLSSATSPDETWSVAVVGQPLLSGSYEIVVKVRDA